MSEQDKAHKLANSRFFRRRSKSLDIYEWNIEDFPDKEKTWNDLLYLLKDKKIWLRASRLLGNVYKDVPDKKSAYRDLQELTHNKNLITRCIAAITIGNIFENITEPNLAWDDLKRLVSDDNERVQFFAISAISSAFEYLPDKKDAWNVLWNMGNSDNKLLRYETAFYIGNIMRCESFSNQAYKLFQYFLQDEEPAVTVKALTSALLYYDYFPDIKLLFRDIQSLAKSEDDSIRALTVIVLGKIYRRVPKNEHILELLYFNSIDKKENVKSSALDALISNFDYIEDNKKAWSCIHQALRDKKVKNSTKDDIAIFIGKSFNKIPSKEDILEDISLLIKNKHTQSSIAYSCSKIAISFFEEKNYSNAAEYFEFASKAYSSSIFTPKDPRYYYSQSLYNYCMGREKIQTLPDILDPHEKIQYLKKCNEYFKKASSYAEKDIVYFSMEEFDSINMCKSIYSAYYGYSLALSNMNDKLLHEVKKDIEIAKNCCSSLSTRPYPQGLYGYNHFSKKEKHPSTKAKKGKEIVSLLESLTNTLDECITGKKLENKKEQSNIKGQGLGIASQYETSIKKIRQKVDNNFLEIDSLIQDLEAPTFKKIAEYESDTLKNFIDEQTIPNTFPLKKYEKVKNTIFRFMKTGWGIVVMLSIVLGIVASLVTILN